MMAIGLFDSDSDNEERSSRMTDCQFKAFTKLCLVLAENAGDVKAFRKLGLEAYAPPYGIFGTMFIRIAETTGDMEKVKQIMQDMLKA